MLRNQIAIQPAPARRWALGVCAETAAVWNISVSWLRIVFLMCTLLSFGLFMIVYVRMWLSLSSFQKEQPFHTAATDIPLSEPSNSPSMIDLQARLNHYYNRVSDKGDDSYSSRQGCSQDYFGSAMTPQAIRAPASPAGPVK